VQRKLHYIVIILLSAIVYGNTLKNGFVLDDDVVFLQNEYVQKGIDGIPDILSHGFLYGFNQRNDQSYRPLVLVDFAIQKSLFGNNPALLHFFNVLYFSLLCCLLFYFLKQLFRKSSPWITFFITLLFVLHPIHTEVVANIKGRDELLHALFLIGSFIAAFKSIDTNNKKWLFLSLGSFFMALLCKEMAITYIVLLPLSVWFFRTVNLRQLFKLILPFGAVLLAYLLLRNAILDTITFEDKMTVMNNTLAAANSFSERIATNLIIFANYIKLLFYPHPLAWDYSYPHFQIVGFNDPFAIFIGVSLLVLGILALLGITSKNKFAFTFLFFLVSFSIVSNFFILIGSTLGERFLFFPSIAFCIFIVLALQWTLEKLKNKKQLRSLSIAVLAIGILFAFKTVDRNREWESNFTLFEAGVKATPRNSRAVSALASTYRNRAEKAKNPKYVMQNYEEAKAGYQKSVSLYPQNADSWYRKTIELDPYHISARNNLGVIYFQNSNFQAAAEQFRNCLRIDKDFQSAYANLGAVYHNLGDYEQARINYKIALKLNPNDQTSLNNLQRLPTANN